MHVKIETKEKFLEISVLEPDLPANMSADILELLTGILTQPVKNVVLNLEKTINLSNEAAETLLSTQTSFYDNSASFVICNLKPAIEAQLDEAGLLENMNITPTLSEAWDIIQMEEIERELLDGF